MIQLIRDGHTYNISTEAFWNFARAGHIAANDFIQVDDGQYRRADEFAALRPHNLSSGSEFWKGVATFGIAAAGAYILYKVISGGHNTQRVENWKRDYVFERDGGYCTYCEGRVSYRKKHIDHSRSRKNGGSNHLNNLRLACPECNLSKGRLNGRDFARCFA